MATTSTSCTGPLYRQTKYPIEPPAASGKPELARALDRAEEVRFWEGVKADYARLQADPHEWADYTGELAEWDHTAGDGLDDG